MIFYTLYDCDNGRFEVTHVPFNDAKKKLAELLPESYLGNIENRQSFVERMLEEVEPVGWGCLKAWQLESFTRKWLIQKFNEEN